MTTISLLKAIRIPGGMCFSRMRYATDLNIYVMGDSYVVIDDEYICYVDPPTCPRDYPKVAFMRGERRYFVYTLTNGRISIFCDRKSIVSEPVADRLSSSQMCIKNVQHEGDTTRLTAQTEEVIVDLLIQWSDK